MPATALRKRLASLRNPLDSQTTSDVQEVVWAFVDGRKAAGWSAERVVIEVKQVAHDAAFTPSVVLINQDGDLVSESDFLAEIVAWSIARYYQH